MGQAAGRFGALQFHIEGSAADGFGGRYSGRFTGKPNVAGRVAGRREWSRLLRPAQNADQFNRAYDLPLRARRRILLAVGHEATIDHDKRAPREARWGEY